MSHRTTTRVARTVGLALGFTCLVGQASASSSKLVAMPSFGDVRWFAITPNNLRVIYIADQGTDGQLELYSIPLTGGPPIRLSGPMAAGGDVLEARLSADGAYVVYRADQQIDGTPDLYSVPIAGPASDAVKLTTGLAAGTGVSVYEISRDSATVVYVAPGLGAIGDLFSVPVGGPSTNTTRLRSATALGRTLDFELSADGAHVVYSTVETNFVTPPVVRQLFSVSVDGPFDSSVELYSESDASPVPRAVPIFSRISPDGTRVVYKTEVGLEVYSVPIAGPFSARIQLNTGALGRFGGRFEISPDGTRVVYLSGLDLGGVPQPEIVYELFSVPIAGPAIASVRLSGSMASGGDVAMHPSLDASVLCDPGPIPCGPFQISPDSTRVVYSANQETAAEFELYSVPIVGPDSAGVKLNGPKPPDGDVLSFDISADGSRVIYTGDQDTLDVLELYSVPIAGPENLGVTLNVPFVAQGLDPFDIAPFVVDQDGDYVVYRAQQIAGQYELFRVPATGPASDGVKVNGTLTSGGEVLGSMPRDGRGGQVPAFDISPDGQQVIYLADEGIDDVVELYSFVEPPDADGDGLLTVWETQFGLNPNSSAGDDGANGDPDRDGRTNAQEQADETHPRGSFTRFFAEGATAGNLEFDTQIATVTPGQTSAKVLYRFLKTDGTTESQFIDLDGMTRHTLDVGAITGLSNAEFSTVIESDVLVVSDRTMAWDGDGYGSHAETSIDAAAQNWNFAEGSTNGFNLFYLIQNATATAANVTATYLRPGGLLPIMKAYAVPAHSRFNIWVNQEDPGLASTDVSGVVASTNGVPIIVERAMYLDLPGQTFGAGHESAGVTTPATSWFFAEGATGSFFDLFILLSNPNPTAAAVRADYLLPNGTVVTKTRNVTSNSRDNIWVDLEDPQLADTAVSTTITVTNGVPIIAERAMWWPATMTPGSWFEAHNSPGSTATGTQWALAEGEVGGVRDLETYILIANTSAFAGSADVTLLFEDGTTATQTFGLTPKSRFNVAVAAEFPGAIGRRFGAVITSLGTGSGTAQIVVERAMYSDAAGINWAAGTNALATRLTP